MTIKNSILTLSPLQTSIELKPREIQVYLPPSYNDDITRCYPVIYMHDGQNLFDPTTSFSGTAWDVHLAAEKLIEHNEIHECIIVGIENTEDRLEEYLHRNGTGKFTEVKAKGLLYERFILDTLIPFVNQQFRTLKGPKN